MIGEAASIADIGQPTEEPCPRCGKPLYSTGRFSGCPECGYHNVPKSIQKAKDQYGNEIDLPDLPKEMVRPGRKNKPGDISHGMAERARERLEDSVVFGEVGPGSQAISPPERMINDEDISHMKIDCPNCGGRAIEDDGDIYCEDCGYHNIAHAGTPKWKDTQGKQRYQYPQGALATYGIEPRVVGKAWEEYQVNKQGPIGALAGEAVKQVGQTAQAPLKAFGDVMRHAGEIGAKQNTAIGGATQAAAGAGQAALGVGQLANNAYQKYKAQQNEIKQRSQPTQQTPPTPAPTPSQSAPPAQPAQQLPEKQPTPAGATNESKITVSTPETSDESEKKFEEWKNKQTVDTTPDNTNASVSFTTNTGQ